tara:strand:- start:3722 stop:3877 length:156 start_codon:yes stop_codon:yes gene_type:complete
MKKVTREEFRRLEGLVYGKYYDYTQAATLEQEVALYARITADLKKEYQIIK